MEVETLKAFLEEEYPNIDSASIAKLFFNLKKIIEDTSLPLFDVIGIVYEFEFDEEVEDTNAYYALNEVIYLLENNAENAKRLFDLTCEYECFDAINKLVIYNDQYLSDTQIQKILPAANAYGFHWHAESRMWSWDPQ